MLTHKEWSAWISVDGQELPQYQMSIEEQISDKPLNPLRPHITYKFSCWIPSEEGKEFSVHAVTTGTLSTTSFRAHVRMDGVSAAAMLLRPPLELIAHISGRMSQDLRTEAPFVFSRLLLTDDESALRDVSHLKDLGIIRVEIDRVAVIPGNLYTVAEARSVAEKGPIHEASKKAGAHCVSYGLPKSVTPSCFTNVQALDGKPFVVFEFRYRSADLLRAQGIIPPPSEPNPKQVAPRPPKRQRTESAAGPSTTQRKVKREEETSVDEEIRSLRDKLRSLEKKRNKENKGISKRRSDSPKVEPSDHSKFVDGEIIDLT